MRALFLRERKLDVKSADEVTEMMPILEVQHS